MTQRSSQREQEVRRTIPLARGSIGRSARARGTSPIEESSRRRSGGRRRITHPTEASVQWNNRSGRGLAAGRRAGRRRLFLSRVPRAAPRVVCRLLSPISLAVTGLGGLGENRRNSIDRSIRGSIRVQLVPALRMPLGLETHERWALHVGCVCVHCAIDRTNPPRWPACRHATARSRARVRPLRSRQARERHDSAQVRCVGRWRGGP